MIAKEDFLFLCCLAHVNYGIIRQKTNIEQTVENVVKIKNIIKKMNLASKLTITLQHLLNMLGAWKLTKCK